MGVMEVGGVLLKSRIRLKPNLALHVARRNDTKEIPLLERLRSGAEEERQRPVGDRFALQLRRQLMHDHLLLHVIVLDDRLAVRNPMLVPRVFDGHFAAVLPGRRVDAEHPPIRRGVLDHAEIDELRFVLPPEHRVVNPSPEPGVERLHVAVPLLPQAQDSVDLRLLLRRQRERRSGRRPSNRLLHAGLRPARNQRRQLRLNRLNVLARWLRIAAVGRICLCQGGNRHRDRCNQCVGDRP